MTLFDYCKEQLEKNPDIKKFEYNGKSYHKKEIDGLKVISGTFKNEIYEDGYYDYDGKDDDGKPIFIKFSWLVCKIKKVGE